MIVEGEGSSEETTDTRHRPLNGLYRLRFWRPGRYVTDVHEITVPFTWTSDIFKVYMSFLGTDGARVSLSTKKERLGDRILVTSVSVED